MTENNYRKSNYCPYCGYFCDAATMAGDPKGIPTPGSLSFCLMCCNPCEFDKDLILQKFDINTINNFEERNRLFDIGAKMHLWWLLASQKDKLRREEFIKNLGNNL